MIGVAILNEEHKLVGNLSPADIKAICKDGGADADADAGSICVRRLFDPVASFQR